MARVVSRHHLLAKSLARGESLELAAASSTYTLPQAERLAKDLVFQELIQHYIAEHRALQGIVP